MDKQLNVTSLEQLAEYQKGTLVELPPFGPNQPFVARVRRPSLLALAKAGKIPNTLLDSANKLFFGSGSGSAGKYDKDALQQTFEVIDILCNATFIEPSYAEMKQLGIELSDDQYMFIFNFTQSGVDALRSFRGEQGDTANTSVVESV